MKRSGLARGVALLAFTAVGSACSYYSDGPPPGYRPGPGQPHMESALSALQAARQQLVDAVPDKGGHRAQAIQLVEQAINQVQMGMEFAGDQ